MVKQIVESAGGQIGVESAGRDKGSTFKISMRMQAVGPTKNSHQIHNSLLKIMNNAQDDRSSDGEEDGEDLEGMQKSSTSLLKVENLIEDAFLKSVK